MKRIPVGSRVRMTTKYPDGSPSKTSGLLGTVTQDLGFGAANIHIDGDAHPSFWAKGEFQPLIRSFSDVAYESTCQKRVTVCELFDANGKLISRESNRCNPDGVCSRLSISQTKAGYATESCNWEHAEIRALALMVGTPVRAVVYGHDFACGSCEQELNRAGVKDIEIVPGAEGAGLRKVGE